VCGIFASVAPKGYPPCKHVADSLNVLYHRGPDQQGSTHVHLDWASITIGVARLAITDVSNVASPFTDHKNEVTVAFVGEIYNFGALRSELFDGVEYTTNCDVEIIPRAWRKWGPCMMDRFNGMFSIILVDHLRQGVFCCRDRAGKKPLFYSYNNGVLYLSSEIKAFPFQIEEGPCLDMDTLEFDFGHSTPVKGIYRLELGEHMFMMGGKDLCPHPRRTKWWSFPRAFSGDPSSLLKMDDVQELAELVKDAVQIRIPESVPVAIQLSGGLDSAIIQSIIGSDRLYCVDFSENGIDNLTPARIAAGPRADLVKPITFGLEDILRELPDIVYHLDTPATWSALALWFMNREISRDGAKVILSGEGADELFNGYSRYRVLYWIEQALTDLHLGKYKPLLEHIHGDSVLVMAKMLDRSTDNTHLEHAKLLVTQNQGNQRDLPSRMARVDFHTTMQVLLRMGDRMAMAHSIENRCPFLDHRIIEFSQRIPANWKITADSSKTILRSVAKVLGVPDQIINEKEKTGLVIPWHKWQSVSGSRGVWSRASFANLIRSTWRAHNLRPSICNKSCN
jgi:asparagine synthase (glutamine-hydrolysing)